MINSNGDDDGGGIGTGYGSDADDVLAKHTHSHSRRQREALPLSASLISFINAARQRDAARALKTSSRHEPRPLACVAARRSGSERPMAALSYAAANLTYN